MTNEEKLLKRIEQLEMLLEKQQEELKELHKREDILYIYQQNKRLEEENKILKDGVKALKQNGMITFENGLMYLGKRTDDYHNEFIFDKYDFKNEDDYDNIIKMLGVIDNE